MYREITSKDFAFMSSLLEPSKIDIIVNIANEYNTICWKSYESAMHSQYNSEECNALERITLPVVVDNDETLYIFSAGCLKYLDYYDKYKSYGDWGALYGMSHYEYLEDELNKLGISITCIKDISKILKEDLMDYNYSGKTQGIYISLYEDFVYNNILSEAISSYHSKHNKAEKKQTTGLFDE